VTEFFLNLKKNESKQPEKPGIYEPVDSQPANIAETVVSTPESVLLQNDEETVVPTPEAVLLQNDIETSVML